MSIQPHRGILNIPNATLRVGKLAVDSTAGFDTVFNSVSRNTTLLEDSTEYTVTKQWDLKMPNIFVATFKIKGDGSSFNFQNTSVGTAVNGYTLLFSGTSLKLNYDNVELATATIPNLDSVYGKVYVTFEKQYFTVTIDGTRVLTYKDTVTRTPPEGEFVNFFVGTDGAFEELKVVAGNWISDGTSNVALMGGNLDVHGEVGVTSNLEVGTANLFVDTVNSRVGLGTSTPGATLDVSGNVYVSSNLEVGTANLFVDTVNSRVGLGTTTPLRTLDIVGDIGVTANTSIFVGSNVVAEYTGPHDRPLRKYPEVALTANDNSSTSGYSVVQSTQGTSSTETRKAWSLFNHVTSGSGGDTYHGDDGVSPTPYNNADGTYQDNPVESLGGVNGTWLYIRLPKKISLDHVKLISRAAQPQRVPRSATFLGSNNGTDWTSIFSFSDVSLLGTSSSGEHTYTYNVNSTVKYEYFGFVWEKVGTNLYVNLEELELYGHEEGDTSVDTTLKSVYNVPGTQQLEVYYDAKDLTAMPTTVTDLAGGDQNGTPGTGVTFDSTYKAFVFDASGSGTVTTSKITSSTLPSTFIDDAHHSVGIWFKLDMITGQRTLFTIKDNTSGVANQVPHAVIQDGILRYDFWSNNIQLLDQIVPNEWYHLVITFSGGNHQSGTKFYINGVHNTHVSSPSSTTNLDIQVNSVVYVGGSISSYEKGLDGSIANFRLFSKALNAGQIQELYDYQKDYFFGTHSSVTLYKGRLGVGTKEPTKELDIVGDIGISANLHMSTASSILVDSNVVAEYTGPHDRPLRKYPEVAMTANDNSSTSGYTVTTSSNESSTHAGWKAFNDVNGTNYTTSFTTSINTFSSGTAAVSRTTGSDTFNHEWLELTLPKSIYLTEIDIYKRGPDTDNANQPKTGRVYGSNGGGVYDLLFTYSDLTYNGLTTPTKVFNPNTTKQYYKIYRLVITEIFDSTNRVSIGEMDFYGHEEGDSSLDTTLKSVYNVPGTQQLEVYYDAKDLVDGSTTVNDLKPVGTAVNGTVAGSTAVLDGAFTFDEADDYIEFTTGKTGNYIFSVSLWFKSSGASIETLFHMNGDYANNNTVWLHGSGTSLTLDFVNNSYSCDTGITIADGNWHHASFVYNGNGQSGRDIYFDGKRLIGVVSGTNAGQNLSLTSTSSTSRIGALNHTAGIIHEFKGSIANFRLYSKALNADQIKELYDYQKDYFLGTRSSVTLYKGHLGIGVAEPSGQLELAGDERIQEYPPRAMTHSDGTATGSQTAGKSKNITYIEGHGEFKASASAQSTGSANYDGQQPYNAFDRTTSYWLMYDNVGYNNTTGAYEDNVYKLSASSGTPYGHWLKLEMPYTVNIKNYFLDGSGQNYTPHDWQIWASNDDNNWTHIHSYSGETYDSSNGRYYTVSHTGHYKMFAIIVTSIHAGATHNGSATDRLAIREMKYFGTPGPTTLDKGSLSLTRSLDVPRISRYDVDTETPRPEKLVVDFDTTVNSSPTDISGQGNHGCFKNGASYSAADKAFNFDGTDDYIKLDTGLTGNVVHSVSMWIKAKADLATGNVDVLFYWGGNGSGNHRVEVVIEDNKINYNFSNNNYEVTFPVNTLVDDRWYHLVFTYNGVGGASGREVYIDGVQQIGAHAGTSSAVLALADSTMYIAANYAQSVGYLFSGLISNYKLYNVALEASEVRKLYNLGRTGRSMVISDTAVGIGKVPEAQLDVRGNLNVDGVITSNIPAFSAYEYDDYTVTVAGYITMGNTFVNQGGCYDTSTGKFTAPITGTYYFTADCTIRAGTGSGASSWTFHKNDVNFNPTSTSRPIVYQYIDPGTDHQSTSGSLMITLNAGDTFRIKAQGIPSNTDQNWGSGYGRFMGYLIS